MKSTAQVLEVKEIFKADKIVENTSWKGVKFKSYTKRVGNKIYSRLSLSALEDAVKNHKDFDNSGAAKW